MVTLDGILKIDMCSLVRFLLFCVLLSLNLADNTSVDECRFDGFVSLLSKMKFCFVISDFGAAKVEMGQVKGDVKKAKLRHRLKLVDVDVKKSKQSCRS